MPWPVEPGSRNGIRIAARSVTAPSGFGGDTLVTLHRPRTASTRWERHPLTASWSLQVTPAAAFQARQLVSAHCVDQHPCVDADSLQTALLLVSELVTNAVRHGTGSVELGLTHSDELFRVYVSDQSNDLLGGGPTNEDRDIGLRSCLPAAYGQVLKPISGVRQSGVC